MAKVGFELWKGPIFLLLHILCAKYNAVLWEYQKQKETWGGGEVYFCYHESTVFWCFHGCSHLDQRYKEQCFQRQKAQALGQTVRFSVKLVVCKVQILSFISTSQDPGSHTSNVLSGYYISIKHGKVRSYNNNQLRPLSLPHCHLTLPVVGGNLPVSMFNIQLRRN